MKDGEAESLCTQGARGGPPTDRQQMMNSPSESGILQILYFYFASRSAVLILGDFNFQQHPPNVLPNGQAATWTSAVGYECYVKVSRVQRLSMLPSTNPSQIPTQCSCPPFECLCPSGSPKKRYPNQSSFSRPALPAPSPQKQSPMSLGN